MSAIRVHGDYQVLVSVHTLVLLESRCAECYGGGGGSIQWDYCCDGSNTDSCPDSCDIQLRFCDLGDLSQFNVADRSVFGTNCVQNSLSDYFDDLLGFDLKAGEIYPDYDERSLQGGIVFTTSVAYNGTGQWVSLLDSIAAIAVDMTLLLYRKEHY